MKGLGRNVLSLVGGNVVAQVISLAAFPILTRLYSTSEFGVFSAYMAVVLMLVPVSTLRFNSALLVAETRSQAENLFVLSLAAATCISLLLTLVALVLSAGEVGGALQAYLWLIPFSVLIQGFAQTIQFWVLRLKYFNTIAVAQVSESVMDRGTGIGLGMGGVGAIGLIAGRIIGPAFNILLLIYRLTRVAGWPLLREIRHQTLWQTLRRFRDFPLFSSWAFFAASAAREAPVLILAVLYSPAIGGLYGLGLRVLNMPMLMIGDALSKALLARIREHRDEHDVLGALLLKIFSLATYLGMLLMLVMMAVGPGLFSYVFGEEWSDAGAFAAVLSPAILLMLNYRIASVLFDLYERQRHRMLFDVSLLVARVTILAAAGAMGISVFKALVVMTLSTSILYATGIVYLFGLVHTSLSVISLRLWRNTVLIMPSAVGVVFVHFSGVTNFTLLGALVLIGLVQLSILLYFERPLFTWTMEGQ